MEKLEFNLNAGFEFDVVGISLRSITCVTYANTPHCEWQRVRIYQRETIDNETDGSNAEEAARELLLVRVQVAVFWLLSTETLRVSSFFWLPSHRSVLFGSVFALNSLKWINSRLHPPQSRAKNQRNGNPSSVSSAIFFSVFAALRSYAVINQLPVNSNVIEFIREL